MDVVSVRIPRGRRPIPLVRVLLGGVALRHHLPLDLLEDVELAIDNVLAGEPGGEGFITMTVSIEGAALGIRLAGMRNQDLRATLQSREMFVPREGCPIDMRVLLGSLVDSYALKDVPGGGYDLRVEKQVVDR